MTPKQKLQAFAAGHPTRQAAAKALRISPTQIGELLRGRRTFSDALLKRLGLERVIVERPVDLEPSRRVRGKGKAA